MRTNVFSFSVLGGLLFASGSLAAAAAEQIIRAPTGPDQVVSSARHSTSFECTRSIGARHDLNGEFVVETDLRGDSRLLSATINGRGIDVEMGRQINDALSGVTYYGLRIFCGASRSSPDVRVVLHLWESDKDGRAGLVSRAFDLLVPGEE